MGRFDTTRWSVVLRARGEPDDARAAMEVLCRTYRPPVLGYIRSHVQAPDMAEDLAQAFFTRFIERAWHAGADPDRGRFRTYLLTLLKRFLIDANAEARAQKRGGGARFDTSEDAVGAVVDGAGAPDEVFEREWARAVLAAAFARLRGEALAAGKLQLFEALSEFLAEPPDEADYARVAETLGLRRNTLAVAVHRLRHRLRVLVRDELAQTTAGRTDLDAELHALREALASGL